MNPVSGCDLLPKPGVVGAMSLQLLRFGATGVLNTLVGLMTIWCCWRVLGAPMVAANLIGYSVGLGVSFFVNRAWTFRSDRSTRRALPRFLLVFAVAYLVNLGTLLVLTDVVRLRVEWATLAANVPYSLVFFAGSRWFVFRSAAAPGVGGAWTSSPEPSP